MVFPEMVRGKYFGVSRGWIRVDVRWFVEQAACYGVNLAFSGFFAESPSGTQPPSPWSSSPDSDSSRAPSVRLDNKGRGRCVGKRTRDPGEGNRVSAGRCVRTEEDT